MSLPQQNIILQLRYLLTWKCILTHQGFHSPSVSMVPSCVNCHSTSLQQGPHSDELCALSYPKDLSYKDKIINHDFKPSRRGGGGGGELDYDKNWILEGWWRTVFVVLNTKTKTWNPSWPTCLIHVSGICWWSILWEAGYCWDTVVQSSWSTYFPGYWGQLLPFLLVLQWEMTMDKMLVSSKQMVLVGLHLSKALFSLWFVLLSSLPTM